MGSDNRTEFPSIKIVPKKEHPALDALVGRAAKIFLEAVSNPKDLNTIEARKNRWQEWDRILSEEGGLVFQAHLKKLSGILENAFKTVGPEKFPVLLGTDEVPNQLTSALYTCLAIGKMAEKNPVVDRNWVERHEAEVRTEARTLLHGTMQTEGIDPKRSLRKPVFLQELTVERAIKMTLSRPEILK